MPVIINNVWMGTRALGPMEKFNIYSWRALGHSVVLYTYHFTADTAHTLDSLGLNVLRCKYATSFETQISTNFGGMVGGHDGSWFNAITGFHQRAFKATGAGIDVAKQPPSSAATIEQYQVPEIGAVSNGPFRVFKKAFDQTNKSSVAATTAKQVKDLCKDVWRMELQPSKSHGDGGFLDKVKAAM